VGGADGVLTVTGSPTQFHTPTRRREGRESVSHTTVELCVCARAMDLSRGDVQRDVTANPKPLSFVPTHRFAG
jgi:hypothetical protein